MKNNFSPLVKTLLAGALIHFVFAARAGLPEPGARIFGSVAINGVLITQNNSTIVIEARRTPTGPPIASYRMGSTSAAGNFYSLKINAESAAPVAGANNAALGASLYLVVRDDTGDLDYKSYTLAGRGVTTRVDFGAVDTDGDGMSDAFELANFGNATGGDPNADPDHDGRPNRREFLQGTNPQLADGRHPADISPADDRITLKELTDYILAWKTGGTWPIEPALNAPNIEDYVTRAGAIWKGGELYVFDNDPVTVAPLWWTNAPLAGLPVADKPKKDGAPIAALNTTAVTRSMPLVYRPNQAVSVTISVTPADSSKAYAVVEAPPAGWTVRNMSHDARWDETNRKIKWGPFFDQTPRLLTYEAVPGPASNGAADFVGRGSFDGLGQIADGPLRMWTAGQNPQPRLVFESPSGGNLSVELHGEAGRRYEVQVSSDLVHWTSDVTVTVDSNGVSYLPITSIEKARFFQLRTVE